MSANVPASVAMDQARELISLRHELALHRALIRQAEAAAGDYLKAPHDDLVGAIKDMRQEILLVRTALNRAAEEVARLRRLQRPLKDLAACFSLRGCADLSDMAYRLEDHCLVFVGTRGHAALVAIDAAKNAIADRIDSAVAEQTAALRNIERSRR